MADSGDDFTPANDGDFLVSKSKLSKKKKAKECVKKPHTSTQNDIPELITSNTKFIQDWYLI